MRAETTPPATDNGGDTDWRSLYFIGAISAVAVLALVPLQIAVFIARPPPATVTGWFALFQESRLLGLVDMDLLLIVDNFLLALVFLALWAAMRRRSPSLITVAVTTEIVAVTTYFGSNTAFEMLALGDRYTAAATDAERAVALAAGQAMLATWQGSAFNVSYVLGALAILLASYVMLRSHVFGRPTAWLGLAFGALGLVPASAGRLGFVLSLASLVPMWAWLALTARRLWRFGRGTATPQGAATVATRPASPPPGQLVPQH